MNEGKPQLVKKSVDKTGRVRVVSQMNQLHIKTFGGSVFSMCGSKAGNRAALAKSAEYPRDFGMAVAALVPRRGDRPETNEIDLESYNGSDHLGSLDDLIKGRADAWWRQQYSIR